MAKKLAKKKTIAKQKASAPRRSSKSAPSRNGRSASSKTRRVVPIRPDDFLSHTYVGEKAVKP